ncbi:hypothetical protein TELCIR_25007 [Teladorsagia circumcincta]|uniref:Uncharacterized protein n=1 Tax=Teladorsagia circumcincta TaxID=45464 RepID=A0A2G9T6P1_TELCI|nr:hypothetical protein TELCIR_25007 [Teladorsagia circumcincta]
MNLLMLVLLPFNVYLANSALAVVMIWKRASGPLAIILGVAVGGVSTALGLSGPARSRSEHLVGHILEADLLDFSTVFYFILNSIDFSNSFSTPVLFYILSRFMNVVQPPQYLSTLKDFFLAVLLIVPGFLSSQISLSLEAFAVAASFLLTILSLL